MTCGHLSYHITVVHHWTVTLHWWDIVCCVWNVIIITISVYSFCLPNMDSKLQKPYKNLLLFEVVSARKGHLEGAWRAHGCAGLVKNPINWSFWWISRKRAAEHETSTTHPMCQKPYKTLRLSMFLVRARRTWRAHGGRMAAPTCPKTL